MSFRTSQKIDIPLVVARPNRDFWLVYSLFASPGRSGFHMPTGDSGPSTASSTNEAQCSREGNRPPRDKKPVLGTSRKLLTVDERVQRYSRFYLLPQHDTLHSFSGSSTSPITLRFRGESNRSVISVMIESITATS